MDSEEHAALVSQLSKKEFIKNHQRRNSSGNNNAEIEAMKRK